MLFNLKKNQFKFSQLNPCPQIYGPRRNSEKNIKYWKAMTQSTVKAYYSSV